MALKLPIPFPIFAPPLPTPYPNPNPPNHRPPAELRFSCWNNANAEKFEERRRAQKEIEDDIRRERRFNSVTRISNNHETAIVTTTTTNETFKSIGTPSSFHLLPCSFCLTFHLAETHWKSRLRSSLFSLFNLFLIYWNENNSKVKQTKLDA